MDFLNNQGIKLKFYNLKVKTVNIEIIILFFFLYNHSKGIKGKNIKKHLSKFGIDIYSVWIFYMPLHFYLMSY